MGRRLNQMVELELHTAGGFRTIEEYADKVLGLARATAFLYMRIGAAYSESIATRFGPNKLDEALRYIAATPEDEAPADVPALDVRVLDEKGRVVKKPFADVSVKELHAATVHERAATGAPKPRPRPQPGYVTAAAAKADAALDRAVGSVHAGAASVTTRLVDGMPMVDVRGVPVSVAEKAFTALARSFRGVKPG